jgi:maltooligosyltrehalose trehalohydrolase
MNLYQQTGTFKTSEQTWTFRVWSPLSKSVHLIIENTQGEKIMPMVRDNAGYWFLIVNEEMEGKRYKYLIDHKTARPDPCSLAQPDGVHGSSEVLNTQSYTWEDKNYSPLPLNKWILYELHTGTFTSTGTFKSLEGKLDYLKDLGINAIELMPVSHFPGDRNWGYDGVYPYAVHTQYGGARKLQELVDAAHKKDIAVVLDVVYNHLGPEGNYLADFGPYFTDTYHTPWGPSINFDDAYSDGVRNYFIENALMWFRDFHIDGLRLDAIHAIKDYSSPHFLKQLTDETRKLSHEMGKPIYLIAESNLNDSIIVRSSETGGYNLHSQWSDDYHHTIHTMLTGEKAGYYADYGGTDKFLKSLNNGFVYDGEYSPFRKKIYGTSTNDIGGEQFVIFNQNHDQIGNRMFGERLSTLVSFDKQKLAAVALFLNPYIPMLFMGEEYGETNPFLYFVNHPDKELNKKVREGRRHEFRHLWDKQNPPDADDPKTFLQSMLSWNIQGDKQKEQLFSLYKHLIQLRLNHPVISEITRNNFIAEKVNDTEMVQIIIRIKNDVVVAFFNFTDEEKCVESFPKRVKNPHILLDTSKAMWNKENYFSEDSEITNKKQIIQPYAAVLFAYAV